MNLISHSRELQVLTYFYREQQIFYPLHANLLKLLQDAIEKSWCILPNRGGMATDWLFGGPRLSDQSDVESPTGRGGGGWGVRASVSQSENVGASAREGVR